MSCVLLCSSILFGSDFTFTNFLLTPLCLKVECGSLAWHPIVRVMSFIWSYIEPKTIFQSKLIRKVKMKLTLSMLLHEKGQIDLLLRDQLAFKHASVYCLYLSTRSMKHFHFINLYCGQDRRGQDWFCFPFFKMWNGFKS